MVQSLCCYTVLTKELPLPPVLLYNTPTALCLYRCAVWSSTHYVHAACNMYTIHMHVYYTLNVHTLYIEWNMYTIHIACNMYTIYITFNIFTLHITYVHNTHAHVHNTRGMHSTHCSDICSVCYVHTSLVWQFMVCTVTTVTTSTQDLPWCNLPLCHWLLQFWTLQLTWPADRMTLVWWYNHCILWTS